MDKDSDDKPISDDDASKGDDNNSDTDYSSEDESGPEYVPSSYRPKTFPLDIRDTEEGSEERYNRTRDPKYYRIHLFDYTFDKWREISVYENILYRIIKINEETNLSKNIAWIKAVLTKKEALLHEIGIAHLKKGLHEKKISLKIATLGKNDNTLAENIKLQNEVSDLVKKSLKYKVKTMLYEKEKSLLENEIAQHKKTLLNNEINLKSEALRKKETQLKNEILRNKAALRKSGNANKKIADLESVLQEKEALLNEIASFRKNPPQEREDQLVEITKLVEKVKTDEINEITFDEYLFIACCAYQGTQGLKMIQTQDESRDREGHVVYFDHQGAQTGTFIKKDLDAFRMAVKSLRKFFEPPSTVEEICENFDRMDKAIGQFEQENKVVLTQVKSLAAKNIVEVLDARQKLLQIVDNDIIEMRKKFSTILDVSFEPTSTPITFKIPGFLYENPKPDQEQNTLTVGNITLTRADPGQDKITVEEHPDAPEDYNIDKDNHHMVQYLRKTMLKSNALVDAKKIFLNNKTEEEAKKFTTYEKMQNAKILEDEFEKKRDEKEYNNKSIKEILCENRSQGFVKIINMLFEQIKRFFSSSAVFENYKGSTFIKAKSESKIVEPAKELSLKTIALELESAEKHDKHISEPTKKPEIPKKKSTMNSIGQNNSGSNLTDPLDNKSNIIDSELPKNIDTSSSSGKELTNTTAASTNHNTKSPENVDKSSNGSNDSTDTAIPRTRSSSFAAK